MARKRSSINKTSKDTSRDTHQTPKKIKKDEFSINKYLEKKKEERFPEIARSKLNHDAPKSTEELELESVLFGNDDLISKENLGTQTIEEIQLQELERELQQDQEEPEQDLFVLDTGFDQSTVVPDKKKESKKKSKQEEKKAWADDTAKNVIINLKDKSITRKLAKSAEENEIDSAEYEQRLRERYLKIHPVPGWATAKDSDDEGNSSNDEEYIGQNITTSTKSLRRTKDIPLPQGNLDILRLNNANQVAPSPAAIQQVEFHPNSHVILVGSINRTISLFEVDGKKNAKVQSLYIVDLPITTASFTLGGNQVVMSGNKKYFYCYDIQSGETIKRDNRLIDMYTDSFKKLKVSPDGELIAVMTTSGRILILSSSKTRLITTLYMNGTVYDICFSSTVSPIGQDGTSRVINYLHGIGLDSEVYTFDLSDYRCVSRCKAKEVYKPTCISVSPNNKFFAIGDYSGVLSIFDDSIIKSNSATPVKIFSHLQTPVSDAVFNHDGQILTFFSSSTRDSLKVAHFGSRTVFSNWPTMNTPLGYVKSVAFSPNSGYMAIGNTKGKVLLFKLGYYPNY
ncbi:U3 small nucleolar RNA-associated protein 18-like protein [Smittium culicis]|uniref:U3 small nucleolar RNA-associated protein 18-like protein n=1 Tax=Smittium culicis TaxID=133412 RepID=A0A1R1Y524_9FUNG|nr:U3 small nucleolar RNA-associated protein 18-like protein [Smittium culicis]